MIRPQLWLEVMEAREPMDHLTLPTQMGYTWTKIQICMPLMLARLMAFPSLHTTQRLEIE